MDLENDDRIISVLIVNKTAGHCTTVVAVVVERVMMVDEVIVTRLE